MPYNTLQRQASWPPTQVRLHSEEMITDDDLDSNPFSYFLTRPEDVSDEDMEDVDLSAGIEEPNDGSKAQPIREISPSSIQRKKLDESAIYDEDDDDDEEYIRDLATAFAIPVTLKEYQTAHDLKSRRRSAPSRLREQEPATRGRGILKVPAGRGRGRTRSLSSGKPHAWREPSTDVWSIPEEDENREEKKNTPGLLSDDGEEDKENSSRSKGKKRVRWAL